MRILIITETLHAGGAETFCLRLCRKLRESGFNCDILNLNPDIENADLVDNYKDLTIKRVELPLFKWLKRADRTLLKLNIDFSLQTYLSKLWIEKNLLGNYDVYHTHLIKVDYLMSLVKRDHPQIKLLSTVHGDYSDFYARKEREKEFGWLNFTKKLELIRRSVNKWIVISEEQQDFFKKTMALPANRIGKIYNGFEAANPLVKPENPKNKLVIGMVARGVELKGWGLLVEAFLGMPGDCELRLIGTGPYLDRLKETYKDQPRIHFLGFHPNPVEEIKDFDVFVLPSLFPYESLPTVIIEALYCGKPVIATNVGEIPAMLAVTDEEGIAGFLLDFSNQTIQVAQLKEYLMVYYQDRELILTHGKLALQAFDKFDMGQCARNYIQSYQSL